MGSQPQNPEFRITPENFHPWFYCAIVDNKELQVNVQKS